MAPLDVFIHPNTGGRLRDPSGRCASVGHVPYAEWRPWHLQFLRTANGQFAQSKRQIGQLQNDLAAAKLQLKRVGKSAAASRQALERELDSAEARRDDLPINGFADTQPSPQVNQYGSLLLQ